MIKRPQYISAECIFVSSVKQRFGGELFFPHALQYESCNKTVISLGSVGSAVARSAVLQISVTPICSAFRRLFNIQGL